MNSARACCVVMVTMVLAAGCGDSGDAEVSPNDAADDDSSTNAATSITTTTTVRTPAPLPSAATGSLLDPCETLTQADAELILATPVQRHATSTDRRCVWISTEEVGGQKPTLSLVFVAADTDRSRFDAGRQNIAETTEDLVIGDAAYFHNDGRFLDVQVLTGSVWFSAIATGLADEVEIRGAEEAAARLVVERL